MHATYSTREPTYGFLGIRTGCRDIPHDETLLDRWEVSQHHTGDRGRANPGNPGVGFNTEGQGNPPVQATFNLDPILQAYRAYYNQQLANPLVGPFIKPFPGL